MHDGLVFDIVVKPVIRPIPTLLADVERHIARQDTAPRQTASDGGYASIAKSRTSESPGRGRTSCSTIKRGIGD